MRNAAHYRRMFRENPSAGVGIALAARALWAAGHPGEDATDVDVSEIHRALLDQHGPSVTSSEALRLMDGKKPSPTTARASE